MFKPTATILAAALILSPAAFAQAPTEVTLHVSYDPQLLASEAGSAELVRTLRREARKVCSHTIVITGTPYTDRVCVDNLVTEAIRQIHSDQSAAGQAIAPAFEQLASLDYALAN